MKTYLEAEEVALLEQQEIGGVEKGWR